MADTEDFNAKLFLKLYSKIALALGVTPSDSSNMPTDSELLEIFGGELPPRVSATFPGQNPEYLLAIYNPGQYIPAGMDPVTSVDDRYALSVLLDVVPQFSWVFKQAASTVSNNYQSILENKETPLVKLDPKQKAALDESIATYDKYIDGYDTYMYAYLTILDQYESARATELNGGAKVPTSLKLKLKAAKDKWDGAGHRNAVESAVAVISQYEALEPAAFWRKLEERYATGTQQNSMSSDFQVVGYAPAYKDWFGEAGWTNFTFSQKDMDNQSRSEAIGVAGNLDMTYGIFRISGDGSYDKESEYTKMDETKLDFECKLMRVSLDRRWMNPLLFWSKAWRWSPASPLHGTEFSSGGDIAGAQAPSGPMTVIPTAVILSKGLKIVGSFDNTIVDKLNTEIRANASVGIGPFSISGQFAMKDHSESNRGTIALNGIEAPDVQIIALICEVMPKCPNPNGALPWPQ